MLLAGRAPIWEGLSGDGARGALTARSSGASLLAGGCSEEAEEELKSEQERHYRLFHEPEQKLFLERDNFLRADDVLRRIQVGLIWMVGV